MFVFVRYEPACKATPFFPIGLYAEKNSESLEKVIKR